LIGTSGDDQNGARHQVSWLTRREYKRCRQALNCIQCQLFIYTSPKMAPIEDDKRRQENGQGCGGNHVSWMTEGQKVRNKEWEIIYTHN
jgi:hypothetical protein